MKTATRSGPGSAEPQQPLRILVAEDNRINQRFAQRLIERAGHQVVVADNGVEVLAKLDAERFDLVLMDIQMPLLDGFETTARIRHQERRSGQHLPIVALTAHAIDGYREHCLRMGMDEYVAKPIRPQALLEAIQRAVVAGSTTSTPPIRSIEPSPGR